MPNGIHFFTDYLQLINQTEDLAYGPVKGKEDTNFRVTNLLKASTDVFAFAACTGEVFMQDAGNGFATIVIKPKSSIGFNGSKIKYFVYKGLKMSSIADAGKKQIIAINITTNAGIPTSKLVEKFHINAKAAIAELQVKNPGFNAIPEEFAFNLSGLQFTDKTHDNYVNIEYFFNKKENTTTFTPLSISQGETIGYFDKDNIGFEIIYGDCDVTLGDLRNKEKTVIADASPSGNLALIKNIYKREQILNYVDACAFYGNFASANSNDDFIQIGLNKDIRLKPTEFKTKVIDKFFTNNDLYIDIRNQHKNSFNLYLNNNNVKISIYAKQNTATAFKEIKTPISYETNNWPLLKIKSFSSILGLTTLDTYLCINIKLSFEGANASYKDKPYVYLVSNDLKLDETKKVITDRKTTNEINNLKVIETKDVPPKYTIDLPNNFTRTVNSSIVPTLIGLSCYFKQPVSLTGEFPSNYFLDNYFSVPFVIKDGKHNWGFYELPNAKTIIKCSNEECFTLSSPTTYKNDYLTFKGFAKDTKGMYFYVIAKTQSIAANYADKDFFEFLDENIKIKNIDFIQKKFLIGGTPHFTCVCSTTANAAELINMHQNVDYLQIVAITTQQQANLFAQVTNIGLDKNAPLRFCLKHKELAVADNTINFNKYELCISGYNPSEQIEQISTGIYFYKEENANERIFISEEYCNKILKPRSNEAEKLLTYLTEIYNSGNTIFGHQDSLAYGRSTINIPKTSQVKSSNGRDVGWKVNNQSYTPDGSKSITNTIDISDISLVTGEYPGVFGWDIGNVERVTYPKNGISEKELIAFNKKVALSGGINTISWHCNDPIKNLEPDPKNIDLTLDYLDYLLYDKTGKKIFNSWMDKIANFFNKLVINGKKIPIIFRPFHEVGDNYFFWWNNPKQSNLYKELWIKTVDALRERKVNNLIYALTYNRNFKSPGDFYPGDDYVDIVSLDIYQNEGETDTHFIDDFHRNYKNLYDFAKQKQKISAVSEMGKYKFDNLEKNYNNDWFSNVFMKCFEHDNQTVYPKLPITYCMIWRNNVFPGIDLSKPEEKDRYLPYLGIEPKPGEPKELFTSNFLKFVNTNKNEKNKSKVFFLSDINLKILKIFLIFIFFISNSQYVKSQEIAKDDSRINLFFGSFSKINEEIHRDSFLITINQDSLHIINLYKKQIEFSLPVNQDNPITQCFFMPNKNDIYLANYDGKAEIWNWKTRIKKYSINIGIDYSEEGGNRYGANTVSASPNGKFLINYGMNSILYYLKKCDSICTINKLPLENFECPYVLAKIIAENFKKIVIFCVLKNEIIFTNFNGDVLNKIKINCHVNRIVDWEISNNNKYLCVSDYCNKITIVDIEKETIVSEKTFQDSFFIANFEFSNDAQNILINLNSKDNTQNYYYYSIKSSLKYVWKKKDENNVMFTISKNSKFLIRYKGEVNSIVKPYKCQILDLQQPNKVIATLQGENIIKSKFFQYFPNILKSNLYNGIFCCNKENPDLITKLSESGKYIYVYEHLKESDYQKNKRVENLQPNTMKLICIKDFEKQKSLPFFIRNYCMQ